LFWLFSIEFMVKLVFFRKCPQTVQIIHYYFLDLLEDLCFKVYFRVNGVAVQVLLNGLIIPDIIRVFITILKFPDATGLAPGD
jgi:hypothetical protein